MKKELEKLLAVIQKNFSLIYKACGDEHGIPLVSKENKTLYIKKSGAVLMYATKGEFIKNGVDDAFNIKDVLIAAGEFNKYFSNIHQKCQYFSDVLELLNSASANEI